MKKKIEKAIDIKYIIYGIAALFILILIIICAKSCGNAANKSPEKVVTSLVESSVSGKEKKATKCYLNRENSNGTVQVEVDSAIEYYAAHGAQKMNVVDCGILFQDKNHSYVYITYNLILKNNQEYPCIGTFVVEESEKKYYIVPASDITEEISQQAQEAYMEFMNTETYAEYLKAYDVFMKKNPGYEEKLAEKIGE